MAGKVFTLRVRRYRPDKAMETERKDLLDIYTAAINAVSGDVVVKKSLISSAYNKPSHVIAIGKVADSMMQGALDVLQDKLLSGLLISKSDNISSAMLQHSRVQCVKSDHPMPSDKSLQAGQELLQYIKNLPENAHCLVLISGGASSLVEVLEEGVSLSDLQSMNQRLLAGGLDIHAINTERKHLSRIKGGKLWQYLGARTVACLMISDVQGDDPSIIGSGLLFGVPVKDFNWEIIATLDDAKQAAKQKAESMGYTVTLIDDFMQGDASAMGTWCVDVLSHSQSNVLIWGGETTVQLPKEAGAGGRNQHLALSAAMSMQGKKDQWLLSIATDGIDGNTQDAGALVDGRSIQRGELFGVSAKQCQQKANSNFFLEESGDLICTGASQTNVMDLVIGLKAF